VTTVAPSRRIPLGSALRCAVYGLAVGLIPGSLATAYGLLTVQDGRLVLLFWASAGLATLLALLAAWALGGRGRQRRRPWLRALDLLAMNALLALGVGEAALRVVQRVAPSRLLWDDSSVARAVIDRRRCEPGLWFRYRCNSRGYPDEEFFDPGPDDYSVALLADSFGVGSVPWSHLFATLAERELRERLGGRFTRVAIDNHAVIGIDLLGYRYLFEHEIRDRAYRQVVVGFFVGNDMERPSDEGRWRRLVRIQGWLPVEVTRRLWLTSRGVERERPAVESALDEEPAFLADPRREPPYFTQDAFVQVEASRALVSVAGLAYTEAQYRKALLELDAWHEELGSRLLLVLIPDEFQVNDALWRRVVEASSQSYALPRSAFQRDLPQKRIRHWAEQRGVRVLDLLPALREAEREARTYHLRDTHWNAHGNRVAGRELARALAEGEAQAER
jgi:hypothetical protein